MPLGAPAHADGGRMVMDYLGSSVSSASMDTLIVALCALLPVATFDPSYAYWQRTPTATLQVFALTFETVYSELYTRMVAVGSLMGTACQREI